MHKRVSAHGGPFTTLVRTYPYGTDPEILPTRPGQPPPLRNTITQQVIWTDKGATLNNARMVPGTPPLTVEAASGMFLVADHNFTTGRAALLLGDFALVSNIDYAVGGGAAATAINIAAAINRLPGFFATFIGPVVTGWIVQSLADWQMPLRIMGGLYLLSAVLWLWIDPRRKLRP